MYTPAMQSPRNNLELIYTVHDDEQYSSDAWDYGKSLPLLQIKHSRSTTSPPFLLTVSLVIHLSIRHRDNRTVSTTATTATDTGVKVSDQQLASPCPGRQHNWLDSLGLHQFNISGFNLMASRLEILKPQIARREEEETPTASKFWCTD